MEVGRGLVIQGEGRDGWYRMVREVESLDLQWQGEGTGNLLYVDENRLLIQGSRVRG